MHVRLLLCPSPLPIHASSCSFASQLMEFCSGYSSPNPCTILPLLSLSKMESTATPVGSMFRTYPKSHHFPTSSIITVILSHLGYCHGFLSQILSHPHLKSSGVFLISFGIKPNGLQSSVLSPHPVPLWPHLLFPLLHTPATLALLIVILVCIVFTYFFFFYGLSLLLRM